MQSKKIDHYCLYRDLGASLRGILTIILIIYDVIVQVSLDEQWGGGDLLNCFLDSNMISTTRIPLACHMNDYSILIANLNMIIKN